MRIGSVSLVDVHRDGMQLLQAGHRPHQKDDQSSSFDSLDGPAEKVGRQCFKILQDEHLVGITQYLMRFFVVGIPYLIGADEQFEGVIYVLIIKALHLHVLDLSHALLLMAAELKLVLVAPKHLGLTSSPTQLAEDVVEIKHLIARTIAHQH